MKFNVLKQDGKKGSTITVDDSVFGIKPNESVVHQAVVAELANSRQGTHAAKNRSARKGGGKKPFKQKGTGVARAGTIRSPIWRGGGITFGPQPHSYETRLPKKMKRLARRSVLSHRASSGDLVVVDEISVSSPKTKDFIQVLQSLNLEGKKVTVLVSSFDEKIFLYFEALDFAKRLRKNNKKIYIAKKINYFEGLVLKQSLVLDQMEQLFIIKHQLNQIEL